MHTALWEVKSQIRIHGFLFSEKKKEKEDAPDIKSKTDFK